jgi:hypothetical protein
MYEVILGMGSVEPERLRNTGLVECTLLEPFGQLPEYGFSMCTCKGKVLCEKCTQDSGLYIFNLLTAWSKVLLEKLIVAQVVKKLPACYGTQGSLPFS